MIKRSKKWKLAAHLTVVAVMLQTGALLLMIANAYFAKPSYEIEHIKIITDSDKRYYAQKADCINLERKECKQLDVKLYQGVRNER